jgi:hypothetical protein
VAAPTPVQTLTTDRLVQGPELIAPAQHRTAPSLRSDAPSPPAFPPAGGGGEPAGGGAPAAGGVLKPYPPINGGYGSGADTGMRLRLGCASPDTYHLSPEDRAACLNRLAQEAKAAAELNINIPSAKQAQWDRQSACQAAQRGQSVPTSTSSSEGTSIRGMGDNPTLRQCGPGDRY